MTAESFQMLLAVGLGFAFAGLCSSGYRLFTSRLPSFSRLREGPRAAALLMISATVDPEAEPPPLPSSLRLFWR